MSRKKLQNSFGVTFLSLEKLADSLPEKSTYPPSQEDTQRWTLKARQRNRAHTLRESHRTQGKKKTRLKIK